MACAVGRAHRALDRRSHPRGLEPHPPARVAFVKKVVFTLFARESATARRNAPRFEDVRSPFAETTRAREPFLFESTLESVPSFLKNQALCAALRDAFSGLACDAPDCQRGRSRALSYTLARAHLGCWPGEREREGEGRRGEGPLLARCRRAWRLSPRRAMPAPQRQAATFACVAFTSLESIDSRVSPVSPICGNDIESVVEKPHASFELSRGRHSSLDTRLAPDAESPAGSASPPPGSGVVAARSVARSLRDLEFRWVLRVGETSLEASDDQACSMESHGYRASTFEHSIVPKSATGNETELRGNNVGCRRRRRRRKWRVEGCQARRHFLDRQR